MWTVLASIVGYLIGKYFQEGSELKRLQEENKILKDKNKDLENYIGGIRK